ncbi:hypothetical protein [uncultured Paraglaciecola sp.]|uniref:hypothetical protein n=1 Tax=uncultured Paraglaciecola sp. TaxID=1765024 RepID=UPI002634DDE1|nr:hypothetical protein [uncultured Paraglaciecola sp.]
MTKLKTYALAIVAMALCTVTQAQTCTPMTEPALITGCDVSTLSCPTVVTLCFTPPATYADGTPLNQADIAAFPYRVTTTAGETLGEITAAGESTPIALQVTIADILDDGLASVAIDMKTRMSDGSESEQYSDTALGEVRFEQSFVDAVRNSLGGPQRIVDLLWNIQAQ